jgi:signal transduction histidine kinase
MAARAFLCLAADWAVGIAGHGRGPALHFTAIQQLFKFQSGRVIALGRAILAALFLVSIWIDQSQPAQAAAQTYGLLVLYLVFASVVAVVTWRNWWLDARLAVPAHAVDMAFFTIIVFSTNGYTSPFFLFFVLPLLSAAIRWGWRETSLTALALALLYFFGGMLFAGGGSFELQRFMVRTAHLLILSAMLIWFGIHQRSTRLFFRVDDIDPSLSAGGDPRELALAVAMRETGATRGLLLIRSSDEDLYAGPQIGSAGAARASIDEPLIRDTSLGSVLLFDCAKDRAVGKDGHGRSCFGHPSSLFDADAAVALQLSTGVVTDVRTGTAEGWLVLEGIPDLSTDYVDLARELGRAAGALLERYALLGAMEQGAGARARLTLARDVHDSIVQFLAGASFRIEAISRSARNGDEIDRDLQELKRLLVEEQTEIRGFISAVRREREFEVAEILEELRLLADRLGRQWSVECKVNAHGVASPIPLRVHFDLQQLIREAVANAVRHGGASRVDVGLAVDGDELRLDVQDNGSGFVSVDGGKPTEPWSLRDRVDRARGSLMLVSEQGRTRISIRLPLAGAAV